MRKIEDSRQLYLSEDELILLKKLLEPGADFDDDGNVKDDSTDEVKMQTRLLKRLYKQGRGDAGALWVSVYECQQVYGGPEEGGWWYWHNSLDVSNGYTLAEAAIEDFNQTCEEFYREYALTDACPHMSIEILADALNHMGDGCMSVLEHTIIVNRGQEILIVIETQLGSRMTTERPFYC